MTTKKTNPLLAAATKRQDDQANVRARVVGAEDPIKKPVKSRAKSSKASESAKETSNAESNELLTKKTARKEPATTLTLYIKVADKVRLKAYCDKNGISCAEAVHDWIQSLPEE